MAINNEPPRADHMIYDLYGYYEDDRDSYNDGWHMSVTNDLVRERQGFLEDGDPLLYDVTEAEIKAIIDARGSICGFCPITYRKRSETATDRTLEPLSLRGSG